MADNDDTNENQVEKPDRKIIPLHKAYIWGIVVCFAALIAVVLFNGLRKSPDSIRHGDYLKLLRDNHSKALKRQGMILKRKKTIGNLEDLIEKRVGKKVVFPGWFGEVPDIEIVGVNARKIDNQYVVFLVFHKDEDKTKLVDFITIYDKRDEIEQFDEIMLGDEEHAFHKSSWGRNNSYFWDLTGDNQRITYGLISSIDSQGAESLALEIKRSLRGLTMKGDRKLEVCDSGCAIG